MKRLMMLFALFVLFVSSTLLAQDEEETLTTYFVDTPITVYISSSSIPWCQAALSFDLETINEDGFLDVAFGRAIGSSGPNRYGIENYNNGSGEFPNGDAEFFFRLGYCEVPSQINNLVFGKLRSNIPRKDLAFLSDDSTFIFLNTGNGLETPRNQALVGKATDGCWGPFNDADDYEDLVVTNGSDEIAIYRNQNNGALDPTPIFSSSIAATRVVLAQLNRSIYEANETNKWDFVSFFGNILSIRLNDNNNGFNSPDTINIGDGISDVAVGDLNNDGYNDIAVASYSNGSVRVYLNNTSGAINHTAAWVGSNIYANRVVIGDLGSPGDAVKNDGLNDLVTSHPQLIRRVFINDGSGDFIQEQYIGGSPSASVGKVLLADVQNTGGLSLVYREIYSPIGGPTTMDIKILHHVGNPAPAPPKNVGVVSVPRGYGNYNDAKITWRANIERDLAGYVLERRITGVCGNGNWYVVAQLDESTTEYIDELSTVGGNNCLAEYRVKAFDAEDHYSDASAVVQIGFGSDIWKANTDQSSKPRVFALHPASPNPFNPSTQIKFDLPEDSFVSLNVFDVLGRKVGEIVNGNYAAGYHSATWNPSTSSGQVLASGVYFARFTATDANGVTRFSKMSKLLLTK